MNALGAKAKAKYVVEIDHGEEKGSLKRIKFRDEDGAIKFAALLSKGKSKARVLNADGQEIYTCQMKPPADETPDCVHLDSALAIFDDMD
jgi:hypothetical protein